MTEQFDRIETIFHEARGKAVADRARYLDEACAGDLALRSEVESLLVHADRATNVAIPGIAPAGMETIVDRGPLKEGPGARIGVYKILQQIGEGGFGVVYMAEQEEPVRRKVAIKIIKLGMDTKQVIARFEAERQALALMDHPNIASVLDAGATSTGRPYFVMELVRGITITEYCDKQKLSPRQRLELFIDVCQAVQHAHQKGIIHRDIKPSNVLVTLHDDRAVPKVIDFGIAKATSHRLTEKTLFTEFRQFIGTPEYMSPDQAEISGLDIDTRSDIYSLGVLLYELLAGVTPFDSATLRTGGHAEIQRIIREVEPPIPSSRVTLLQRHEERSVATRGETAGEATGEATGSSVGDIARHRRVDASGLRRMLRGELDWIVMRAMEKDRTRRYQTAGEFVADIRRFLADEPVLAGPPSAPYKLRKFVRRHRVSVGAGSLVLIAVLAGLSLATVGFLRASAEARRSQSVSEFLQSIIVDVDEASDDRLAAGEITARGRELFGDEHAVIGTLLTTRAASLRSAGRLDDAITTQREAVAFFERLHGGDHPSVVTTLGALARLEEETGDAAAAEEGFRVQLAMSRRVHGDDSRVTGDALADLARLVRSSGDAGRDGEMRALWRESVEVYERALGPDHATTVNQLCDLAVWLHNRNYDAEAAPLLEVALERARRVLAPDDMTLFKTVNAVAQRSILKSQDFSRAVALCEELLVVSERVWGPTHEIVFQIRPQLVYLHAKNGDLDAAEASLIEYLDLRDEVEIRASLPIVGAGQQVWIVLEEWFDDHVDLGRRFFRIILGDIRGIVNADGEQLSAILREIAGWLVDHGFDEDGEPLLAEQAGLLRDQPPSKTRDRSLAGTLVRLASVRTRLDRPIEGEAAAREAIAIGGSLFPADDWHLPAARSVLGGALAAQGRRDEAEPILIESFEMLTTAEGAPAETIEKARSRLVTLYEGWGRPQDAERWR